jgi:hypothetical protein
MTGKPLLWNYHDNIFTVGMIPRITDGPYVEYYVYDAGGSRVRKVNLNQTGDTNIIINEVVYLGNFEIRRDGTGASENERHSIRYSDGKGLESIVKPWLYYVFLPLLPLQYVIVITLPSASPSSSRWISSSSVWFIVHNPYDQISFAFPELKVLLQCSCKSEPDGSGHIPIVTKGHWLSLSSHTCTALRTPYG